MGDTNAQTVYKKCMFGCIQGVRTCKLEMNICEIYFLGCSLV